MKKRLLSFLLCAALLFTTTAMPAFTAAAAEEDAEYEIYPIPQSVEYTGGSVDVPESVSLVLSDALDEATVLKVNTVLSDNGISVSDTSAFTVTVAVDGDAISGLPQAESDGFFDNTDSYILTIEDNSISIVGKDTDAAFYGVVTLKLILNQCGDSLRTLRIDDYSDAQFRGFIEGYYGIPWSDEDRISLMTWGGDIKLNSYVFAPKDDPYHSSMWTTLYPEERLEEMKAMVEAGINSKCRFIWTIHPFMYNAITTSNYDERLAVVKAKFEQLYSIGVRQFGILADDASSSTTVQRQLCIDMSAWCEEKGDCYDLLFCPSSYNYSWTTINSNGTSDYFDTLMDGMPENVQIFWTGNSVCAAAEQSAFDRFTALTGREALMWINWPCNDINSSRVLLGRGELLEEGVTGFTGIISNPMQQAEPSKVALFAVADYTWNRSAWDADASWEASFKYVEPEAAEALHTMAKHLSDPSPNNHGEVLTESEEIAPLLNEFTTALSSGASVKETGEQLVAEFDEIINACNEFEANASVTALRDQLQPWTDSLRYLATAAKNYILCAVAIEDGNDNDTWGYYSLAAANYSASQNCEVEILSSVSGTTVYTTTTTAQAGAKRLIPFTQTLASALSSDALQVINPDAEVPLSYSVIKSDGDYNSVYSGSEDNITDGDSSTFCWYHTTGNSLSANGYIGVDLGDVFSISGINIIQDSSDNISDGVLEYSADGTSYTEITGVSSSSLALTLDAPIQARYIRLRTNAATGKWLKIYEFTVETASASDISAVNTASFAYTNVPTLAAVPVSYTSDSASLTALPEGFTLAPGQYVGVALTRIKAGVEAEVDAAGAQSLTLEYSMNGVEWTQQPSDARYVRLINNTDADVTVTALNSFAVTSNEIDAVSVVENTLGSGGDPLLALDGDLSTIAEFQSSQASGNRVIYDLGQTVAIDSLRFVMYDGENDFVRNGIVSISADGESWTDVITLGNGSTDVEMADIYTHDVSYYVAENDAVGGAEARYIKLELTSGPGSADKWTAFSEIEINNNAERATTTDPTFVQNPVFYSGKVVGNLIDSDVNTTYVPKKANSSLIYHLSEKCGDVTGITVLQSPLTLSNAKVSVRTGTSDVTPGDVNLDGAINAEDATLVLQHYAEINTLEGEGLAAADVDGRSGVDSGDATCILQYYAEIITGFAVQGSWEEIGTLSASLNKFENLDFENVLDVKIEWTDVIPELHEMFIYYADEEASGTDKSALEAKLAQAEELSEIDYTAQSYAALANAMLAGRGVLLYNASTEEDISSAIAAIDAAIAALQTQLADTTALNALISEAQSVDEALYTEASLSALQSAIEAAQAVAAKDPLYQSECDEAVAALQSALDALVMDGTQQKIDSSTLTGYAGSYQSGEEAQYALDDNTSTKWHTDWYTAYGDDNYYIITLDANHYVNKLEYLPRQDSQTNGNIIDYEIYYSSTADGDDWKLASSGTWANDQTLKASEFIQVDARRIKIVALSTEGDGSQQNMFISATEFYLYEVVPNTGN